MNMLCVFCADGSGCERVEDIEVEDWESEDRSETGNTDAMPGSALKDSLLFESKSSFSSIFELSLSIPVSFSLFGSRLFPSLFSLCRSSGGQ